MSSLIIEERRKQVLRKKAGLKDLMECDKHSTSGSVSQRACVFCGSRVVLYPVADALHLIHGPIGCAAYTWDIRGSLSSGPELNRLSFSTDLKEKDVIYGGEKKLEQALRTLIKKHSPSAAFVYSTCIVGLIGDDVDAICKKISREFNIPVLPVHSEGFRGTKKDGYKLACDALMKLVGTDDSYTASANSINILGEFNLAGEAWIIKEYYKSIGVDVISTMTGDGRVGDIRKAHKAKLNVVQCSGSMISLAKDMEKKYGIPYIRVSYFGIEDMSRALYDVAKFFSADPQVMEKSRELVKLEMEKLLPSLENFKQDLKGRRAGIYVGGAFKAFSLIKSLRHLGMKVVLVGSQTGNKDDYNTLIEMCDTGTVIVDDSNPVELSRFAREKSIDVLIGGVKERPIAYKMGFGFCDHNHERKTALAGFIGMYNFAREVHASVMSPVWNFKEFEYQPLKPALGEI